MFEREKILFFVGLSLFVLLLVIVAIGVKRQKKGQINEKSNPILLPSIVLPLGHIVPQKPYPTVVDQYVERVNNLFGQIGHGRDCYVSFFNLDHDTYYMHALFKMTVGRFNMWFIFYPNPDYDIITMIFDKRISRKIIDSIKDIIDKFYNEEGKPCNTTDNNPDFVWDRNGKYFIDAIMDDLERTI